MNATKKIQDFIEKPHTDEGSFTLAITSDSVDVTGYTNANLQISPGKYTYIDISDTSFCDSVFNNVSTFRSTIIRCTFAKSQMTGLQLPEGNFKHVIFKNCRMNLTNFRNAVFENCMFDDSDLSEADFAGSQFTNVLFLNCKLENTAFSHCRNLRLEFEHSSLALIQGVDGLKRSVISEQNLFELAPQLAEELDIAIK
jgi:uncharacterized protein YjbI with pentapeptide repeats